MNELGNNICRKIIILFYHLQLIRMALKNDSCLSVKLSSGTHISNTYIIIPSGVDSVLDSIPTCTYIQLVEFDSYQNWAHIYNFPQPSAKLTIDESKYKISHCNGRNNGIVSNFEVNPMQKSTIKLVHLFKASNMIFWYLNHSYPSLHP
jgi:hypothetical protein